MQDIIPLNSDSNLKQFEAIGDAARMLTLGSSTHRPSAGITNSRLVNTRYLGIWMSQQPILDTSLYVRTTSLSLYLYLRNIPIT